MIRPDHLKKGDTIGVVTPSNPIDDSRRPLIDNAVSYLGSLGLSVTFASYAFEHDRYGVSGGTPEQRADDINSMFADTDIDAIWCVQGGDTANQTLEYLDFELIRTNPKIFLGKSDIDLLHMAINKMTGLVVFHGPDLKIGRGKDLDYDYSKKWFEKRLFEGEIGKIEPVTDWFTVRGGTAEGRIIGCNLSTIIKLAGTEYFPDFENALLFLESYKEDIGTVIYRLTQLKQIGVFDAISGLVIGYILGFQDEEELQKNPKTDEDGDHVRYEDLVLDITDRYDFPILKINEFGHYYPNAIIPIGATARVDADDQKIRIIDKVIV